MSQENKVTITLIAVVILFFVCQTPNALQLLHIIRLNYHSRRNRGEFVKNVFSMLSNRFRCRCNSIHHFRFILCSCSFRGVVVGCTWTFLLVLNNIFNLLITVNAASNFILYCLLSDKYRKTVKALLCGVRTIRRNTLSSSRFTSGRTTTSSIYSRSRTSNIFKMPIYKQQQQQQQREPRFSISSKEYANLQAETAKRNRFSITTLTSSSRNNSIVSVIKISFITARISIQFAPFYRIRNHLVCNVFHLNKFKDLISELTNKKIKTNFRVIVNQRRKFRWNQRQLRAKHWNPKSIAFASHLHHPIWAWVVVFCLFEIDLKWFENFQLIDSSRNSTDDCKMNTLISVEKQTENRAKSGGNRWANTRWETNWR